MFCSCNTLRHILLKVIALQATLIVSACVNISSYETLSFSEDTQNNLDEVINRIMVDNALAGAVIGVWIQGKGTWIVAKGYADVKKAIPMKITDKFKIASITKSFTATMVLKLVDIGKLKLSDTLDKYVPNVPNSANVTILQLLNHTSGINDDDPDMKLRNALKNEPFRKWTPKELVNAYTGNKIQGKAGVQYEYSNVGYIILGMVVEKASGETIENFLKKNITRPLGLKNTYFPQNIDIKGEYAHGYDGENEIPVANRYSDWTDGAMISTLQDLKVWAEAVADGKLLSSEMHREQFTWIDILGGKGEIKSGLGIEYEFGFVGKNGDNPGYQCEMMYSPENKTTIIILFNKMSSDGKDFKANEKAFVGLSNVLFPGIIPEWYQNLLQCNPVE